ncbi:hypothetical protein AB0G15_27355 [Streptosporangium sp. NPDC023825]|uniref:hypothetical protein n=1 Tax=Streptosporangium sp. NPDC023825 TaxID=3154909 RepID=UPI0034342501
MDVQAGGRAEDDGHGPAAAALGDLPDQQGQARSGGGDQGEDRHQEPGDGVGAWHEVSHEVSEVESRREAQGTTR